MSQTAIKNYSKKELCFLYGISRETLLQWVIQAEVFTPEELIIYKTLRKLPTTYVQKIFESKIGYPEL